MNDILVETRNLTKDFRVKGKKYIRAVDNVSIKIGRRENLVLVGESGCGKSTLGRLTLGLIKPTSGQILFGGKDIWKMSKSEFKNFRINAQIIHQDPYSTFNPVRTIYQSLSAPLLYHKIVKNRKEAYEKVGELFRLVGLVPVEDFYDRYPSRMSGGQLQRAAIARAISLNPKYIVADEAVSMLDASLRLGIVDLLLDLQKKFKISYLFITHDLAIARYFVLKGGGGGMAVMYLGSVVEIGLGDDIVSKPYHPHTNVLITTTPIPDPELARKRPLPKLRSLEVPRLTEVPPGCKFHTRCPYAEKICEEKVPELREVNDRLVACHFAENFVKGF